jgi:hypothetical protein
MGHVEREFDEFLLFYGTCTPALCKGVLLIVGREDRFYIGYSHHGFELKKEEHLSWCQSIDGRISLNEIFRYHEITRSIFNVLTFLLDQNIIELSQVKHDHADNPETMIQSQRNFLERVTSEIPELRRILPRNENISTIESSIDHIRKRVMHKIFVIGENRLAINIYSLLLASGYSESLLIERESPRKTRKKGERAGRIAASDICGLYIRESDLSLPRSQVIDKIRQSSALNRTRQSLALAPSLVISTQTPPPESVQRWMSEDTPHLVISHPSDTQIEIGPLVIPGHTPCIQCMYYSKDESDPHFNAFELARMTDPPEEISSGAVAYIAGLITMIVNRFLTSGQSELLGTSWILDLTNPLNYFHPGQTNMNRRRLWSPHPTCGCINSSES